MFFKIEFGKKPHKIFANQRSQTLVLVVFIVVIFVSTIASIASLTTRELEVEEIQERALNAEYAAETGEERAREILSRGYAVRLDGVDDYINVGLEKISLFDDNSETFDQFTIEGWFKVDSLDFTGFKPIIVRGVEDKNCGYYSGTSGNKGCMEGSILLAGKAVNNSEDRCKAFYGCCPKRLHVALYIQVGLLKGYFLLPITPGTSHKCEGGEIAENKWYHFILTINSTPQVTAYFFLNGSGESWGGCYTYYQIYNEPTVQRGFYNIRIGTTMKNDAYFPGAIDEIRIYKHPPYCANPPTFWTNIEPGQPNDPNDPLNHYLGIYGYQDNIPPCNYPLKVCSDNICNNWYTQYYPPNYNMETHDLIFYYDFDASPFCYTNSTSGCIKDKSPSGDDNGTPVGFNTNGQEIPAAPNFKNPVFVDVTQYGKVVFLNKDTDPLDLNPMQNGFSYGFYIVPNGKTKEGISCSCGNPTLDCCCSNYCIFTYTKGIE